MPLPILKEDFVFSYSTCFLVSVVSEYSPSPIWHSASWIECVFLNSQLIVIIFRIFYWTPKIHGQIAILRSLWCYSRYWCRMIQQALYLEISSCVILVRRIFYASYMRCFCASLMRLSCLELKRDNSSYTLGDSQYLTAHLISGLLPCRACAIFVLRLE